MPAPWPEHPLARILPGLESADDLSILASRCLASLASLLDLGHGALHLFAAETRQLHCVGRIGSHTPVAAPDLQDGWSGPCIDLQTPIDVPQAGQPVGILQTVLLPLSCRGHALGILELGTRAVLAAPQQTVLAMLMPVLGQCIDAHRQRKHALALQAALEGCEHKLLALAQQAQLPIPVPVDPAQTRIQAEARYLQLVAMSDALPLVVFQLQTNADGAHRYNFINHRVQQILGVSAEALLLQPDLRWRHVHADDKSAQLDALRSAAAGLRAGLAPQKVEATMRVLFDGRQRWIVFSYSPSRPDAAGVVVWNGFYQDITDRRQAQDKLIESEAYNKMLFQQSHRAMVVYDPVAAGYIDCNEAAVKLYGFSSRDQVLGKTPLDVSSPTQYDGTDSLTKMQQQNHAALAHGVEIFEWKHRRPSGEDWDAMCYLMEFNHGGRKLLQFTLDDITERKRNERQLLFSNNVVENTGPM